MQMQECCSGSKEDEPCANVKVDEDVKIVEETDEDVRGGNDIYKLYIHHRNVNSHELTCCLITVLMHI